MRYVVHAFLFAAILCVVTASAHDVSPESNRRVVNMEMVAQVEVWLSLLTEQQHKAACFPFKSDERMNWHFIPRERLGLSLKAMNLQQRRAATMMGDLAEVATPPTEPPADAGLGTAGAHAPEKP